MILMDTGARPVCQLSYIFGRLSWNFGLLSP